MKTFHSVIMTTALVCATACTTTTHRMNTDTLQGTWICVSAISDGKPLPKETIDLLRLTLTQNRYKTEKGEEVLFDSAYSVDSSKSPKQINMIGTEGDLAGKEAQGIYSLESDTLVLCYTMPGTDRPTTFESASGSKAFLVVWRRTDLKARP